METNKQTGNITRNSNRNSETKTERYNHRPIIKIWTLIIDSQMFLVPLKQKIHLKPCHH